MKKNENVTKKSTQTSDCSGCAKGCAGSEKPSKSKRSTTKSVKA